MVAGVRRKFGPCLLVLACFGWVTPGLAAPDASRCALASEQGQQLRDEGKLREARSKFIECAAEVCPQVIRQDCSGWLKETETRQPTVIFDAKDDRGRDLGAVRVLVDGKQITTKLEGRPVEIDPGPHHLIFESEGFTTEPQDVIIKENEKGRRLLVPFHPRSGGVAPTGTSPAAPKNGGESAAGSSSVPIVPIALGGVAVLGLAGFTYFFLSAASDAGCSPNCSNAQIDDLKSSVLIADISLGVGIAAGLGAGAYLLFAKPSSSQGPSAGLQQVRLLPTRNGGALRFDF